MGRYFRPAPGSSGSSSSSGATPPTVRIVGDSIVSQNELPVIGSSGSPNTALTRSPRFWSWFVAMMGGAIRYETAVSPVDLRRKGSNSGVGGDTWSQISARLDTILPTAPESHILLHGGTNNINAGTALASIQSDAIGCFNKVIAAGKTPILTTVLPRNGVDGANDWGATLTTAAQKRLVLSAFNEWILDYAREKDWNGVNWSRIFSDASGSAHTGWTAEGLHPNATGGYWMATELKREIGYLFLTGQRSKLLPNDDYDATYNPSGDAFNGDFSGTGGATADSGGTGTITGTIPDNSRLNKKTATTTSCAASIVARPDGAPGNALRLDWTSLGTGNVNENWRYEYFAAASTNLTPFANVDDPIAFDVEMRMLSGHNGIIKFIAPKITGNNVTKTAATISFDAATNQIRDSANGLTLGSNRSVIVSGTTNNNKTYKVLAATASVLQIDPSTPVTTEAAGASVSIVQPIITTVWGGGTGEKWPDVDTGVITMENPTFITSATGLIVPYIDFFINGTISGPASIILQSAKLYKRPFTPALLSIDAHDQ